jgi:hypothetical protein
MLRIATSCSAKPDPWFPASLPVDHEAQRRIIPFRGEKSRACGVASGSKQKTRHLSSGDPRVSPAAIGSYH